MDIKQAVGKRVKELRNKIGISQEELVKTSSRLSAISINYTIICDLKSVVRKVTKC